MPNYKESNVVGTSWQRAYQVLIENPYNGTPSITFNEEAIIDTGSEIISKHVYALTRTMAEPTTEFQLKNPFTGDVIGVASYQDAYVMLSSLYMALAEERDAAAA